jgi:hypothetical protein
MTTFNTGPLTLFPSTVATITTAPESPMSVSVGAKTTVTATARKIKASDVESAIYGHIKAVRALGRTKIAPEEIARALDLPLSAVEQSLSALQNKGVKILRHG